MIDQILIALLSGGHCLITGAPGLAKTLLVKSIAQIFHLKFQRIQFTPDLMPADITGHRNSAGHRRGPADDVRAGTVFANMILADEINRTPPKTQAALLEAMQEHQVTAAGVRHACEEPFFVLATQNPIEMEGTYPLPEAQLDRFMFNVVIDYLPEDEEVAVVTRTTSARPRRSSRSSPAKTCCAFMKSCARSPSRKKWFATPCSSRLPPARTRPNTPDFVNEWVSWGAGTRAGQFLVLGAKARALLAGPRARDDRRYPNAGLSDSCAIASC